MKELHIAVLTGTTRPKNQSTHAAKFVYEVGKTIEKIEVKYVDPAEFTFPYDGNDEENKDPKYTEITAWADGFFIITPEYNHGIPGSLKRMLDSELKNYKHKPVAFGSVSAGPWGGIRAIENLLMIVRELGMIPCSVDIPFPSVQEIFDENGKLIDRNYTRRVKRTYDELIWMAKVMKYGREEL